MDKNSNETTVRRFHKKSVDLKKELGKGQFGKVYKASIRESNVPKVVAIKIIWPVMNSGEENIDITEFRKQAYSEMYKMSLLKHENIVKLLGMVESDIPWFVCEYMKDGNLLQVLRSKSDIKDNDMIKYCYQITNGMEYLHQHKFLHKDLAARNILLDGKTIKIADMGLSSFATEQTGGVYSINGKQFAFRQAARECIVEQIYTFETDVWAFGVLMYEIWSRGSVPYGQHATETDVRRHIVDGHNPLHARSLICPAKIQSLMMNHIFIVNWLLRPSFTELKQFFDGLLKGKGHLLQLKDKSSQQFHNPNNTPSPLTSPQIIEPDVIEQEFRVRSNSNSAQRPTSPRPGELHESRSRSNSNSMLQAPRSRPNLGLQQRVGMSSENSESNPDLLMAWPNPSQSMLSASCPKQQYFLNHRRGSVEPFNNEGSNSSSPLSSSPSHGNQTSSWLFSSGISGGRKLKRDITPQSSLELPYDGTLNNKSSSSVSLYPEFIPGRFYKDRRVGSQELLNN